MKLIGYGTREYLSGVHASMLGDSHREPQQVDVEALCKFCVSPFSVPLVDKITGDLVPFWPVCLNHDESANQLHRRLKVGHHSGPFGSDGFTPYFSRGWRDDAIQRAYLEASYLHWGDPANNPISSIYGGRMVHVPECAAWTWDARPYPFFPELTDVWTDGPNWRLGHWLTGRLGAVSLAALVRHLCLRAGMLEALIDVTGLWGAVEGYAITALEAPRSSISTLARHFGFDAIETEGMIRFVMRGRASSITLTHDDLVASREGEALELVRAQETELPQALKWQVARADEDYDAALVEARRITVDTTRIASESFPISNC